MVHFLLRWSLVKGIDIAIDREKYYKKEEDLKKMKKPMYADPVLEVPIIEGLLMEFL